MRVIGLRFSDFRYRRWGVQIALLVLSTLYVNALRVT